MWTGTDFARLRDLGNICWVNIVAQPVRTCIGLFGLGPFGSRIGIAVAAFRFCALGCSCAVSSDESDIFHRQCDFRSWGGASSMPGVFSESSGSCRRRAAAGGLSLRSRRVVSRISAGWGAWKFPFLPHFDGRRWTAMEIMEAMFGAGWPSSSALILSLTPSAGAGVDLSQREVKVVDKQVVCIVALL